LDYKNYILILRDEFVYAYTHIKSATITMQILNGFLHIK